MSRKLSEDLNNPYLFEENKAGDYTYERIGDNDRSATGSLTISDDPVRDPQAQREAGGEERRDNDNDWGADDGGHLIGARFGGSPGEENLTAQSRNLNRSDYKSMEDDWAKRLNNNEKVFVHIETSGGERPNAYMGYAIYESEDGKRDYDTFHYANESRSEISKWEAEADELGEDGYDEYDDYVGNLSDNYDYNDSDYTGVTGEVSEDSIESSSEQTIDN